MDGQRTGGIVGIDVGGTFTDLFFSRDGLGVDRVLKVPSTPDDPSRGLVDALAAAGVRPDDIDLIVHGTTIATNAVIERKGARCALVTTRGFRDILELGRRDRQRMYGLTGVQNPLIPRDLRWEVDERLDHQGRVMLANNVGSATLSGKECTANMTHWTFDTAMLARSVGTALYASGGDSWFFVRADYVFGKALRDDAAAIVEAKGGRVVGEVAVPLGTTDFGSALLRAQQSGAKVVALALAGNDLLNCLKQAAEFGLTGSRQTVAALIIYIQDIKSLGLPTAKGTRLTESFYWDFSDRTRGFTRRVIDAMGGKPPNMGQAGAYSAVLHYLKAAADLGPAVAKASGRATVERMKQLPIDDDVLVGGRVRPDGRVVSDVHLFEVKRPEESRGEWDLYKLVSTLGPDQAWRPMNEGGCPLVRT